MKKINKVLGGRVDTGQGHCLKKITVSCPLLDSGQRKLPF